MSARRGSAPRSAGALLLFALWAQPSATWQEVATPSSQPDLSGTYDIATLTPLQRPAQYGDNLTLTPEQAQAIADHWRRNFEKDYAPSDPNREAPPEGGTGIYAPEFTGAAGKVGGYNAFYVDIGDGNFQLDGEYRTSIITEPSNGRMPALTDAAKKRYAEGAAFRHENTGTAWWIDRKFGPYDDPELRPHAERCLLGFGSTAGPPALPVMYNNMKRIVQTDTHVMILVEMNHDARVIRLNSEHDDPGVRKWLGDSIGWWEGDTLVVSTKNFGDRPGLSSASRDLHVTERFTRLDADTLHYEFTVDDPSTWTRPWKGDYVWPQTTDKVYEYACHEGNYAMGNIMRGARLLEAEAPASPPAAAVGGRETRRPQAGTFTLRPRYDAGECSHSDCPFSRWPRRYSP